MKGLLSAPLSSRKIVEYLLLFLLLASVLSLAAYGGYWYGTRATPAAVPQGQETPAPTPPSPSEGRVAEEIANSLCAEDGTARGHLSHLDKWSADKKYVTCESGTAAAERNLRVISIEQNSITDFFGYRTSAYAWSPDSRYLGYSRPENVDLTEHPTEYLNEGSGSSSLILYDTKGKRFDTLFEGDKNNGYSFVAWEAPGKLVYKWFDPQRPDDDVPGGTPSKCFSYNLSIKKSQSVECD